MSRPFFPCEQYGVTVALALATLSACSPPTVISTPNSCSTLIPDSWAAGVPGAPLPDGDTVGDWISFGDAQTGKLDSANGRTRDSLQIISKCEARDLKAVRRATRPWWKLF